MKVCIFSSYYKINKVPNYVIFWLEKLKPYFDKIILVTNSRPINNYALMSKLGVDVIEVKNEGYDFGMWYKVMNDMDMSDIGELCLVNDSTVLFKNIDKMMGDIRHKQADVVGVTDSNQYGYHLQSYFLYFKNSEVVSAMWGLFNENKILHGDINFVINNYEIKLSNILLEKGFKLDSIYSYKKYNSENISVLNVKELIADGVPMIKKKILLHQYREEDRSYLEYKKFDFSHDYVKDLRIKAYSSNENINIDYLIEI